MPPADAVDELTPEDVLSSSLEYLYQYQPITCASAGDLFIFTARFPTPSSHDNFGKSPLQIKVRTPDTQPANWSLHASSIWVSARYLADHFDELDLERRVADSRRRATNDVAHLSVLELGAGAGLPGILISKVYGSQGVAVTLSDYPDEHVMRTLSENVARNGVSNLCRVVPYAWGSDVSDELLASPISSQHGTPCANERQAGFDIIIAADTLWNRDSHQSLLQTLCMALNRTTEACVHLIAGLHTGRYVLQSFMIAAVRAGFHIALAEEREVRGVERRIWDVSRAEGEGEADRRRWVVWIILKWT